MGDGDPQNNLLGVVDDREGKLQEVCFSSPSPHLRENLLTRVIGPCVFQGGHSRQKSWGRESFHLTNLWDGFLFQKMFMQSEPIQT